MACKCNMKVRFACGLVGIVLLVAGCVLITVFNTMIHSEVNEQVPLKNGSESYNNWKAPPVPIYFQVWMYDVKNPTEILQGRKPTLSQKGPYTYREKRQKQDIEFHDNGTITYRETRTFFFERTMSTGPEEDTFTSPNLVLLTVFNQMDRLFNSKILKWIINKVLKFVETPLFTKLSVKDLMWGYKDPLFAEVNKWAKRFKVKSPVPEEFGLFYQKNGSDDGLYEIYSGQTDIQKIGKIVSWNGQKELSVWTSDIANRINGSDGTIYHPFIDVSEIKYLFSSDLYRSLGMSHIGSVTQRGIPMERFVAPVSLFANASVNEYNAGFCTPKGNCLPSGLLNASSFQQGAPVAMSMPNLNGCDEDVINAVSGVQPSEFDQSFLDIEPMTGVVMNAGKKLQINVIVENVPGFSDTDNIKNRIYFPVLWLNESALIDAKDANKFKSEVLDKLKLTDGLKYGLIALGGLICLIVLASMIKYKMQKKYYRLNVPGSREGTLTFRR